MAKFTISANIAEEVYKAIKDVKQYDEQTQLKIKNAIRAGTRDVMVSAISRAPYKTGKLKISIGMSFSDRYGAQGIVVAKSPHAKFVEYGVQSAVVIPVREKAMKPGNEGWYIGKAIIPARPAHPFMRPAMEEVRPKIENAIKDVLK